jgi:hypothetical protein
MRVIKRFRKLNYRLHDSFNGHLCFYCGERGNSRDHIPATSYAEFFEGYERIIVRCCVLCNSLLGNRPYHTIQRRAEFLLYKYPVRFRKALDSPFWSEEDIAELGGILKRSIIRAMAKKKMAERKIEHLRALLENAEEGTLELKFVNEVNVEL